MNKGKDDYLCRTYPKFFSERYLSPNETAMCWGFDCGDGWFDLIEGVAKVVEEYNNKQEREEEWIRARQVKEKFGGLRIYCSRVNEEIDKAVSEAEARSFSICEECGGIGEVREGGWVRTLCDKCNEE